jgi:hypothetical protein
MGLGISQKLGGHICERHIGLPNLFGLLVNPTTSEDSYAQTYRIPPAPRVFKETVLPLLA